MNKQQKKLLKCLESVLNGDTGIIEGALDIIALRRSLSTMPECDEEFGLFKLISSDTDHWPVGEIARSYWDPERLKKVDRDMKDYEDYRRESVFKECRALKQLIEEGKLY